MQKFLEKVGLRWDSVGSVPVQVVSDTVVAYYGVVSQQMLEQLPLQGLRFWC